jgi:hypothetical protein
MKAERKVNIIRALKSEIDFYKRQLVPVNVVYKTDLNHLRLCSSFSRQEVMQMPKDVISPLLVHKIVKAFEDSIMELPIETEYDEHFGVYRASLDLWVKPKRF